MKLAKAMRVTRTALNNFINGATTTQDRVRARIASYYLRVRWGKVALPVRGRRPKPQPGPKLQRVAEQKAGYAPGEMEMELKKVLPPTREAATRWIDRYVELVRRHPDEAPPNAAALEPLLRRIAETLPPE